MTINTFHKDTNQHLKRAIEFLEQSQERVRIFYGDTKTGVAWPEENDVLGRIGCSTGKNKIPLLIHNSRSTGGGPLLDSSIVAIKNANGFIYRQVGFTVGDWEVLSLKNTTVRGINNHAAYHNGQRHASFYTRKSAENYCKFMEGYRMSK